VSADTFKGFNFTKRQEMKRFSIRLGKIKIRSASRQHQKPCVSYARLQAL